MRNLTGNENGNKQQLIMKIKILHKMKRKQHISKMRANPPGSPARFFKGLAA